MERCSYCGSVGVGVVLGVAESVGAVVSRGFCGECVAAHVGRACEARPGACEICDGGAA